jgi:hypothetical protein
MGQILTEGRICRIDQASGNATISIAQAKMIRIKPLLLIVPPIQAARPKPSAEQARVARYVIHEDRDSPNA